jgi:hypothetical protein
MPHLAPGAQGLSTSSTGPADDAGSNKRLKKAPPKPYKSNLRPTILLMTWLCFSAVYGRLLRSSRHEQGSSDDVGEREERVTPHVFI